MNVTTPAVRAAALDQTAHGHIDAVDPEGGVRGWCAAEAEPFGPRSVTVLVDGKPALTGIICDLYRKDLLAAGIGDGHHGFAADLPRASLRAGEQSEISLIDEASGLPVGQVITQVWREPAGPSQCWKPMSTRSPPRA